MIHSKKIGGIGESTKFEFQYLPRIGMLTELGHPEEPDEKEAVSSSGTLRLMTRHSKMPIRAVLVVGTIVGAVAVVSLARFVGSSSGWLRGVPRHLLSSVMAQTQLLQSLA
jgi:hypothetical protein